MRGWRSQTRMDTWCCRTIQFLLGQQLEIRYWLAVGMNEWSNYYFISWLLDRVGSHVFSQTCSLWNACICNDQHQLLKMHAFSRFQIGLFPIAYLDRVLYNANNDSYNNQSDLYIINSVATKYVCLVERVHGYVCWISRFKSSERSTTNVYTHIHTHTLTQIRAWLAAHAERQHNQSQWRMEWRNQWKRIFCVEWRPVHGINSIRCWVHVTECQ